VSTTASARKVGRGSIHVESGTLRPVSAKWTLNANRTKAKLAFTLPILVTGAQGVQKGTRTIAIAGVATARR